MYNMLHLAMHKVSGLPRETLHIPDTKCCN